MNDGTIVTGARYNRYENGDDRGHVKIISIF